MARKQQLAEQLPARTAAIYARYSSNAQNDASIEQQVAECTQYAQQNGLVVVSTFEDRAISGRSDKRPGFQRMIRAAERQQFQVLLTYKSNRIARNMYDALRYEARLDAAGVKVVYCKEDFGNNAAGKLALRMMMSINEFYSDNMAEDIRRGLYDSAAQGKVVGNIPYGYKKGEDGKYAIDEINGPVVQEIFDRVLHDESYADIARDLNARGFRTKNGKPFGRSSFKAILTNERYTGVYTYGDDIRIDGGIPKLVEKEVFDGVKQIVDDRQRSHGRQRENGEYLLTGRLFCGECLGMMTGISGKGRWGVDYFYYSCNNKRLKKCDKKNIRRDQLEEEVARCIHDSILDDKTLEWICDSAIELSDAQEQQSPLPQYEERLRDTKKQIGNIVRAVEMGIISVEFKDRMAELQAEKQELEGLIATENSTLLRLDRDKVMSSLLLYRNGDVRDKAFQKRLINTFVKAIYLYDGYFKLITDFSGERKTYIHHFKVKLDNPRDIPDSTGVCISSDKVHHYSLIQTPDSRNCIDVSDSGFVITWYFGK